MKICFLCEGYHKYRGGIESFIYSISKSLIKNGHEVHIITVSGDEKYYLDHDKNEGLYIHKVDLKNQPFRCFWNINKVFPIYEIYFSYVITKKLNKIINNYSIDIFESSHLHFWYFKKRIPFVIRLHGYAGFEKRYSNNGHLTKLIRNKIKLYIEKRLLKKVDALISVSCDHAKAVSEVCKFTGNLNFNVIHNGIDSTIFSPPQDNSKRHLNVLFVGRIKKEKGVDTIIDAIPIVLKKFPETKFIFIGMDSINLVTGRSHIELLRKKVDDNRVVFLGALSQEEVIDYYKKNSICIFPSSFREPFPLVTLESMACGCAVIATKNGGFLEVINNGLDGFLVSVDDHLALSDSILTLLKDKELLNDFSRKAIEKINKRFTIEKTTEKTLIVYKKAINKFYNIRY